ncbi:MAG: hypothetical protein VCA55_15295 [Verrucomicrobiales bacterium]
MKSYYLVAAIIAAMTSITLVTVRAGEGEGGPTAPPLEAASSFSGSFSLGINSHHMSSGRDIYGDGSGFHDVQYNPMLNLNFDLGNGVTLNFGSWAEFNGKGSPIANGLFDGDNFQEIDFWTGISFAAGGVDVSLSYQEWIYLSDSERILDVTIGGLDLPLDPTLKFHGRLDKGAAGATHDEGVITSLGGSLPGFSLGDLDFEVPVSVAFATDGYHGGDSGYAYSSIGLSTSFDLTGPWSLSTGLTYYFTDSDVIPGNPDEGILTGGISIGMSF